MASVKNHTLISTSNKDTFDRQIWFNFYNLGFNIAQEAFNLIQEISSAKTLS